MIFVPCAVDLVADRMNMNWSQRVLLAPPQFAVRVLIPRRSRVEVDLPRNVTLRRARVPGKVGYFLGAAMAMAAARLRGIDAVLTERSSMTLIAWACRRLGGFVWVVDIWDLPEKELVTDYAEARGARAALRRLASRLKVGLFGLSVRSANLVICSIVPAALDRYRIPRTRLRTFRNAIDLRQTIAPPVEREPLSICFVTNRFLSDRRLDLLAEAVDVIWRDHGLDATVALVGDLTPAARAQIRASRRASRFQAVGRLRVHDLHRLMARSEVGVIPLSPNRDLANIYPVKLLEHMALGNVIVATDLPGVREVVENERHALLVPPDDGPALATALARVLTDSDLRNRLQTAAKAEVQRYDSRVKLAAVYTAIESVVQGQPRPRKARRFFRRLPTHGARADMTGREYLE